MSDSDQESGTVEEQVELTLEDALLKNWSAAGEDSPKEDESADSGDVSPDVQEPESEQASDDELEPLEPLERWSDTYKEAFKGLDRQAQEFILERHKELEGDYTKKTQELAEQRKEIERISKVLEPYTEVLSKQGVEIEPHLAQALQYYFAYTQDPAGTLRALAQNANLTQEQLFEAESDDPSIRALKRDLDQTRAELAKLRAQPKEDYSAGQRQIDEFASAKDESGNPKHPYFEQVRSLMAPLVDQGKSLEEAYNDVVWSIPDYRKSQMDAERKQKEKAAKAAQAQKVAKAKKASEVLPASDVVKGDNKGSFKNWEGALKESLSNLGG